MVVEILPAIPDNLSVSFGQTIQIVGKRPNLSSARAWTPQIVWVGLLACPAILNGHAFRQFPPV